VDKVHAKPRPRFQRSATAVQQHNPRAVALKLLGNGAADDPQRSAADYCHSARQFATSLPQRRFHAG
jgi:hypothetical protein